MKLNEMSTEALMAELACRKEAGRMDEVERKAREYAAKVPPVGQWKVTTEGDCEGKSVRSLGTYEGHVSDIAAALAKQAMYSLTFEPATVNKTPSGTAATVCVSIYPATANISHLKPDERGRFLLTWLACGASEQYEATGAVGQFYGAANVDLVSKKDV